MINEVWCRVPNDNQDNGASSLKQVRSEVRQGENPVHPSDVSLYIAAPCMLQNCYGLKNLNSWAQKNTESSGLPGVL